MAEGVVEVDTLFRVLGVCLPNFPFLAVSNGGTLRYILGPTDCRGEKSWRPEGVVSMPSPWTGKERGRAGGARGAGAGAGAGRELG